MTRHRTLSYGDMPNPGKGYCWYCGGLIRTPNDPYVNRRRKYCSAMCAYTAYLIMDWGGMAAFIRRRDGNRCQGCGTTVGNHWAWACSILRRQEHRINYGVPGEVHHIRELQDAAPDDLMALMPANLQLLCSVCHGKASARNNALRKRRQADVTTAKEVLLFKEAEAQ